MKTQKEIVTRIHEIMKDDPFGFEWQMLADYLDFEHVKPFLNKDAKADEWERETMSPKAKMIDYMEFAWEKANNQRGISAWRSLAHYKAWLWLDGDNEIWPILDDYTDYGKHHLVTICDYLGLDVTVYEE